MPSGASTSSYKRVYHGVSRSVMSLIPLDDVYRSVSWHFVQLAQNCHTTAALFRSFIPRSMNSFATARSSSSTMLYRRSIESVSYTHLRAHETGRNLVCRLLLEK